jgi:undecaprenyl-diphosphatase
METILTLDRAILVAIGKWRSPVLNRAATDVTSLGSPTVAIMFAVVSFTVLWVLRDRIGAARVITATVGAQIWVQIIKRILERPRPTILPYLVEFSGFSFPSGHTLVATAAYGTLAAVLCRHVRGSGARIAISIPFWTVVILVALSRVYLGVHYPSDTAGGVLMGLGWFYLAKYLWRDRA